MINTVKECCIKYPIGVVEVSVSGGGLLWMISPQVNLITAFVIGIIGTVYFILFGKDVSAAHPAKA